MPRPTVPTLRPRLPRITAPLAIRLSRWSLPFILLLYVILVALWTALVAVALHFTGQSTTGFWDLLRRALWAMWGPDNLLSSPGESVGYYAVAVANAIVSALLPIFALGAFVFKLFRHDPLVWRKGLTIEAHPTRNYVLAIRFYNRFKPDLADVSVRAWVRWVPPSNNTVFSNRPVKLLVRGTQVDTPQWPLAAPAEPTTIRVLLCRTEEESEPLRRDSILVQGEWLPRESAKLVVVVTGTTTNINEEFRSTKIYTLSGDVDEIQEDIFQDITPGKRDQEEWRNFHGSQAIYIFMYGSLMRDSDLRREGIEPKRAIQVTLQGWRREWNVASDPSAKDRVYLTKETNSPYMGMVASIGIERHLGSAACGIMARVDYKVLAAFDAREQEYDRTDVTHNIRCNYGVRPEGPFRVFTYVPKDTAVEEFAKKKALQQLAIRRGYYDSILDAATLVGDDCARDLSEANSRLDGVRIIDMDFPGSI